MHKLVHFSRTFEPNQSDEHYYSLEPICNAMGQNLFQCWYASPLKIVFFIFFSIILFRECLELKTSIDSKKGWKSYLFSPENWLQILILFLSFAFYFIVPYNTEFGIHIGAWAVFLAWLDITTLLGKENK